jgi:hypothetical protein
MDRARHRRFIRTHSLAAAFLFTLAVAMLASTAVALVGAATAQGTDHRIWVRPYNYSDGNEIWYETAKGPFGSVYVAGLRTDGGMDGRIIVAKYSRGGKRLWLRVYAGYVPGDAGFGALAVDAKGNAFVTGEEQWPELAGRHIFLVKFGNSTGKRLWVRRYNGPATTGNDQAKDIALGAKGAVYVAGARTATGGGFDALLMKYVDKGAGATRAWVRTYAKTSAPPLMNTDLAESVVVDPKGRVYFGGSSDDGTGHYQAFIRRVKTTGGTVWTKRFPHATPGNTDFLVDMATTSGFVVGAGYYYGDAATGTNGVLWKVPAAGAAPVVETRADPGDESFSAVACDRAGAVVAVGRKEHPTTHVDAGWLFKLRKEGWGQQLYASPDPTQPAVFTSVAVGASNAIYCGGQANSGVITGFDFVVAKYTDYMLFRWADSYDDQHASGTDLCNSVLYIGGSYPGLYGAGIGGASPGREALLVKYER